MMKKTNQLILPPEMVSLLLEQMTETCDRVLELFDDGRPEAELGPQMAIVNPSLWEVGHVAWFFEKWILRNLYEANELIRGSDTLYDSAEVIHDSRWDLHLPNKRRTIDFVRQVLENSLAHLVAVDATDKERYFFELGTYHADMHAEALTYTRQTLGLKAPVLRVPKSSSKTLEPHADYLPHDVLVPGGWFNLGARKDAPFVFDNEKWAHPVNVKPFWISTTAVTYGEFEAFVNANGYERSELWSQQGWHWKLDTDAKNPMHWEIQNSGEWFLRRFDELIPLPKNLALIHVNWHEANAYCQWAGRRLPTEAEWEMTASCEPSPDGKGVLEKKRLYPWGDTPPSPDKANLDWSAEGTIDVRSLPGGDSAFGCRQMIGNVWELTSSVFEPYPGFIADPYKEYSEPWFGDHVVLRGGCWATRSRLIRNTWRNFYKPDRRDVMAGFRTCAI